ncbi:MAG TPA: hypothetical protein ENK34_03545 [Rhodobacteraceae bacterium]|nr:hypothetical protein [Paracoccaceae bacterium]
MIRAALAFLLLLPAVANACETLTYKSNDYTLCQVTLDDDLRLFHSDADGRLLGSFSRINAMLEQKGQTLGFAMNAGMYHSDRSPVGLFIENGKERAPLADGGTYGNFGLKPNGVFCFGKDRLAVIETNKFRDARPACDYATQSGPMLVIDGALHPRFLVDATSRYIRNGVGVSADGTRAYFVISDNPVTFHEFGSLFRDHLKTPNALYFDGKVSRLFAPDLGRSDSGFPLGVIVGTVISR